MKIEASTPAQLAESFAKRIGAEIKNGRIIIPPEYGEGYYMRFDFDTGMSMLISNHSLKQDIVLSLTEAKSFNNLIIFKFDNIIRDRHTDINELPSVKITTQGIRPTQFFPKQKKDRSILITINSTYLRKFAKGHLDSSVLKSIFENKQPLIFEEFVDPNVQRIVDEMDSQKVPDVFLNYFFKLKAEELILNLLMALVNRDDTHLYALNAIDIQAIYKIKEHLLQSLASPPTIKELSVEAGMSESKLKRLFKQVFGKSIFNYYQSFRMQEASRLLKEEKLSVSEVGYQLGFSNLSHFSKVFEEHIGMKPKKYSMAD